MKQDSGMQWQQFKIKGFKGINSNTINKQPNECEELLNLELRDKIGKAVTKGYYENISFTLKTNANEKPRVIDNKITILAIKTLIVDGRITRIYFIVEKEDKVSNLYIYKPFDTQSLVRIQEAPLFDITNDIQQLTIHKVLNSLIVSFGGDTSTNIFKISIKDNNVIASSLYVDNFIKTGGITQVIGAITPMEAGTEYLVIGVLDGFNYFKLGYFKATALHTSIKIELNRPVNARLTKVIAYKKNTTSRIYEKYLEFTAFPADGILDGTASIVYRGIATLHDSNTATFGTPTKTVYDNYLITENTNKNAWVDVYYKDNRYAFKIRQGYKIEGIPCETDITYETNNKGLPTQCPLGILEQENYLFDTDKQDPNDLRKKEVKHVFRGFNYTSLTTMARIVFTNNVAPDNEHPEITINFYKAQNISKTIKLKLTDKSLTKIRLNDSDFNNSNADFHQPQQFNITESPIKNKYKLLGGDKFYWYLDVDFQGNTYTSMEVIIPPNLTTTYANDPALTYERVHTVLLVNADQAIRQDYFTKTLQTALTTPAVYQLNISDDSYYRITLNVKMMFMLLGGKGILLEDNDFIISIIDKSNNEVNYTSLGNNQFLFKKNNLDIVSVNIFAKNSKHKLTTSFQATSERYLQSYNAFNLKIEKVEAIQSETILPTSLEADTGYAMDETTTYVKGWDKALTTNGRTFAMNCYFDKRYENKIFFSYINKGAYMYDVISAGNWIDTEDFSGDSIVNFFSLRNGDLLVFKRNSVLRVDLNNRKEILSTTQGLVSKQGAIQSGDSIIFASQDGIYITNGGGLVKISDPINDQYQQMNKDFIVFGIDAVSADPKFTDGNIEFIFTKFGWLKTSANSVSYYENIDGKLLVVKQGNIVKEFINNNNRTNFVYKSAIIDMNLLSEFIHTERFVIRSIWVDAEVNTDRATTMDDPENPLDNIFIELRVDEDIDNGIATIRKSFSELDKTDVWNLKFMPINCSSLQVVISGENHYFAMSAIGILWKPIPIGLIG